MDKFIGSVRVNTETGQLFSGDTEIKCPYDVVKAYESLNTFEWLKDNYANDEDTLWQVARESREVMREIDCPSYEAIEIASISLGVTLVDMDELEMYM